MKQHTSSDEWITPSIPSPDIDFANKLPANPNWLPKTVLAASLMMALCIGLLPSASPPHSLTTSPASLQSSPSSQKLTSNIEDLEVGDYVLAKDPESGKVSRRKVVHLVRRTSDHLRILKIKSASGSTQTIETTDEHPFFLADHTQRTAGELKDGDRLAQARNQIAVVLETKRQAHPNGIPVYNFEVEGFHTYFVSEGHGREIPLWVHNSECDPPDVPKGFENTKEFQFADRTWFEDIEGYRDLKANIANNGLDNKLIEYVEIGGQRYVVRGNGRLQIAEDLGLADQLLFQKVELPFLGYRNEADVIEEALNIIYNRPRGIQ